MRINIPESQRYQSKGFLRNLFNLLNFDQQKPVFWLVILIFIVASGIGYWVGNKMVLITRSGEIIPKSYTEYNEDNSYIILETDDLSISSPKLLSIWVIHFKTGSINKLGFTPVVTTEMTDSKYYELLSQFSLNNSKIPSQYFLTQISKYGISHNGYIVVDHVSAAAFLNWFEGPEKINLTDLDNHSMANYGKTLRGLCGSLSFPSTQGANDYPWSTIYPEHFQTSIQFTRVLEDFNFLTNTPSPTCEMVPLK